MLLDASGNRNHGALTNMVPEHAWVPGEMGDALTFDSSTGDLVTASALSLGSPYTLIASATPTADTNDFANLIELGTDNGGIRIDWRDSKDNWEGYAYDGISYTVLDGPNVVLGQRVTVAFVHTGSWIYLYIDGVLVADSAEAATLVEAGVYIGARPDGSREWQGLVDYAMIYGRALSGDEVRAIPGDQFRLLRPQLFAAFPVAAAAGVFQSGLATGGAFRSGLAGPVFQGGTLTGGRL